MSRIWDRFRGQHVAEPEIPAIAGRYRLVSGAGFQVAPTLEGTTIFGDRELRALAPSDQDGVVVSARAIAALAAIEGMDRAPVLALGLQPQSGDAQVVVAYARAESHLRSVMANPAELLARRDELVGLGRAGRLTPRTLRRLASHADDWRWRRGRSVEPARLLVERLDAELDRVENRMAINVGVELQQRFALIQRDVAGQLGMANPETLHLNHRVLERTTSLWQHTFSDAALQSALQRRGAELDSALQNVRRLRDSALGRALPWRFRPADTALGSNLVRDHESYAEVARLWRILRRGTGSDRATRMAEAVAAERRYDTYVSRCVQHAVHAWCPLGSSPSGLLTDVRSTILADGSVEVAATTAEGRRRAVTVVPTGVDHAALGSQIAGARLTRAGNPVVIAALSTESALRHLAQGSASVVGLGPYVLTGVEYLGVAIRWHLEACEVSTYPKSLRPPSVLADALKRRAAVGFDLRWSGADVTIHDVTYAGGVVDMLSEALPFAARTQDLKGALDQIDAACRWTRAIRRCPVCGDLARTFTPAVDSFRGTCACGGVWGIDRCGRAGHKRPFLWVMPLELDAGLDQWSLGGPDGPCPFCSG